MEKKGTVGLNRESSNSIETTKCCAVNFSTGDRDVWYSGKIEKQLQIQLEPSEFLLKIIRNKLADLGVRLNRLQLKTLRCQLKETNPAITFDLTALQVARAKIKSRSELEKAVELVLSEIFSEAFQKIDKIKDRLPDIMLNLAEHAGEFFFRQIRRTYRYGLNNRREHQAYFEKDILSIWGRAITQLEVLLILSIESIGYIDKMFHAEKTVYSETKWGWWLSRK
ncbi:MAG: hypothetical protein ACTFAK_12780 [Candidatus Electronema sp. VV]